MMKSCSCSCLEALIISGTGGRIEDHELNHQVVADCGKDVPYVMAKVLKLLAMRNILSVRNATMKTKQIAIPT